MKKDLQARKSVLQIIALALVLIMSCLAFASCSKSSPEDQIKEDFEQYREEISLASTLGLDEDKLDLDKDSKASLDELLKKMSDFEYEIGKVDVDEDKATATVTITTYDFGKAYRELLDDAANGKWSNLSTNEIYVKLIEKLAAAEDKSYTKDVTVNCTKNDGKWETDISSNNDVLNALFGGTLDSFK